MVRGEGMRVWDADGREYLDFFSGILSTSLGHCHPRLVSAVSEQVEEAGPHFDPLCHRAPGGGGPALGRNRAGKSEDGPSSATAARKPSRPPSMLACIHTGRTEVIALRSAYHGRSTLATNLTGLSSWRPLPSSLANIKHTMAPYPYRCRFKTPCDESCAEEYARDLEEVILSTTNGRPAAFLAETIQGAGGFVVPPPGYFQRVAEIIRGFGGVLIIDEVQAGFGRTGKWFGIEHWGVVPDIMVMAKGIAGGHAGGRHHHHRRDRRVLDGEDHLHLRRKPHLHGRHGGGPGRHARGGRPRQGRGERGPTPGRSGGPGREASTGSGMSGGWA